jgi:hypothetical protein
MLFFLAAEVAEALYLPATFDFAFRSELGLKSVRNLLLSSSFDLKFFRARCFFFLFFSSKERP